MGIRATESIRAGTGTGCMHAYVFTRVCACCVFTHVCACMCTLLKKRAMGEPWYQSDILEELREQSVWVSGKNIPGNCQGDHVSGVQDVRRRWKGWVRERGRQVT